jgi:hypothetical protein
MEGMTMRRGFLAGAVLAMALALNACSQKQDGLNIPPGTDVTIQKKDGVTVSGKLVEVQAERVVLEDRGGVKTPVPRSEISAVRAMELTGGPTPASQAAPAGDASPGASATPTTTSAEKSAPAPEPPPPPAAPAAPAPGDAAARPAEPVPEYREVVIPAGTTLAVELKSSVASDTSQVEDAVRGALRRPVMVKGVEALPAGAALTGHVTEATRSARVKGRARIAFRFTQVEVPHEGRVAIRTESVAREAEATTKQDTAKIGGGAVGGAIIGGILGGGGGAAKGAAIGGAAGTGVVLSTRGKEVRLGPGAAVSVRLAEPLSVRVKQS